MSSQYHLVDLSVVFLLFSRFFFNDPPTTEIYTLSLHDALPISLSIAPAVRPGFTDLLNRRHRWVSVYGRLKDRKSTRLNSSHITISYAVFCLKKKIEIN